MDHHCMDSVFLSTVPLLRGIVWAVLGVGLWVVGIVVAHYVWERYRGTEEE